MSLELAGFTVVFDLDGTLVDTAPDLVAATNHALADLGLPPVPPGSLRPYISHGARRMIQEGLSQSGTELDEAGVDALLARFLTYYEANIANESQLFDGARDALAALLDAGARLAICTNKRERLSRLLLDALAVTPSLHAIAGRDTFPVSKPHPDHLTGAIALAGGDVRRAIMVGDTIVDMETAAAARVPAVLVAFGYSDVPPDRLKSDIVINHFRELYPAIAGLQKRPS